MENNLDLSWKIKNGNIEWSNKSPFGHISKKHDTINTKPHIFYSIHSSIIYHNQDDGIAKMPINKRFDQAAVVYLYLEYYVAIKKDVKEIILITWRESKF